MPVISYDPRIKQGTEQGAFFLCAPRRNHTNHHKNKKPAKNFEYYFKVIAGFPINYPGILFAFRHANLTVITNRINFKAVIVMVAVIASAAAFDCYISASVVYPYSANIRINRNEYNQFLCFVCFWPERKTTE